QGDTPVVLAGRHELAVGREGDAQKRHGPVAFLAEPGPRTLGKVIRGGDRRRGENEKTGKALAHGVALCGVTERHGAFPPYLGTPVAEILSSFFLRGTQGGLDRESNRG